MFDRYTAAKQLEFIIAENLLRDTKNNSLLLLRPWSKERIESFDREPEARTDRILNRFF